MPNRSRRRKFLPIVLLLAGFLFLSPAILYLSTFQPVVLMYHFVGTKAEARENPLVISEAVFQEQIGRLKRWGYTFCTLDDYYEMKTGRQKLKPKSVVLTFDDGNRDFYEKVVPILTREKAPAASFLIWNSAQKQEMGSMSFEQIKELLANPLVTFGVHTATHRNLVGLTRKEYEFEITASKKNFEGELDKPFYYFSYPGGHFDDAAVAAVNEAGYRLAFTTSYKRLRGKEETLFTLPRIKITERDRNPFLLWAKVSGFYSFLQELKFRSFRR